MQMISGELVKVYEEHGVRMGKLRVRGVTTSVALGLVPNACVGDRLLAHVGVALSREEDHVPRHTGSSRHH